MSLSALELLACFAVVLIAILLLIAFTIHDPLGGADEGYLWYGVAEVAAGRVPVRDFRSYEPGRYWWSWPFHRFIGRGLWVVRIAATTFLAACMFFTASVLRGIGHSWTVVVTAMILIAAGSIFPHKRFDQGSFLCVMASSAWLLADPSVLTAAIMGLTAGAAVVIGANLGLYATVTAGLTFLTAVRGPDLGFDDGFAILIGAVLGAAPLWVSMLCLRGLGKAFWQRRVVQVVGRRSTNLRLPVPVPWRPPPGQFANAPGRIAGPAVGWLFVLVPTAAAIVLGAALFGSLTWTAAHPLETAVALTTIPAWHHVISRADLSHLAQVIAVPLIGLLAALDTGTVSLIAAVLITTATTTALAVQGNDRLRRHRSPHDFVRRTIGPRSSIWFKKGDSALLDEIKRLTAAIDPTEELVAVPMTLWLLPFLGRRSAVYDTFCVYPASDLEQQRMIAEIEASRPPLAIVGFARLDRRDDLRFFCTHPHVWSHISTAYELIDVAESVPTQIRILRRRLN